MYFQAPVIVTQIVLQALHSSSEILRHVLHAFVWRIFQQAPQHGTCPKFSMWLEGTPRTLSYFGFLCGNLVHRLVNP
jgi:hypothetical protein